MVYPTHRHRSGVNRTILRERLRAKKHIKIYCYLRPSDKPMEGPRKTRRKLYVRTELCNVVHGAGWSL